MYSNASRTCSSQIRNSHKCIIAFMDFKFHIHKKGLRWFFSYLLCCSFIHIVILIISISAIEVLFYFFDNHIFYCVSFAFGLSNHDWYDAELRSWILSAGESYSRTQREERGPCYGWHRWS